MKYNISIPSRHFDTIRLDVPFNTIFFSMSDVEPYSFNSYEVMPFDLSSTNHQAAKSNEISQGLLHIFHFLANQKNITSKSVNGVTR